MKHTSKTGFAFVAVASIVSAFLPALMARTSFMYMAIFYPWVITLPMLLLCCAPKLRLTAHILPVLVCIGFTRHEWIRVYQSDLPSCDPPDFHLVGIPLGLFLVSNSFFYYTLPLSEDFRKDRYNVEKD